MDNSTIGSRISLLVKQTGLTRIAFGARIGISSGGMTMICNGKSNPSAQTVSAICREFSVNRRWLETGEGDMFLKLDEAEKIVAWVNGMVARRAEKSGKDFNDYDDLRMQLISVLIDADDDFYRALLPVMARLVEKLRENEKTPD